MSQAWISYSREDILRYKAKSVDGIGVNIVDHQLFHQLSNPVNNQLLYKRTKRGTRAGKRSKFRRRSSGTLPVNNRKPSHLRQLPRHKPPASPAFLPTIFYTNCRSLNAWKLAELEAYIEIHKPNIICLTETWLDVHKQQIIKIDGFDSHFSNRKN